MLTKYLSIKKFLLIIFFITFLLRVINLQFPSLTIDEARVAYRGYTIATIGRDEFGRSFPILFNSLEDYQLPVPSYLTALGIFIFGKNDFGARIPFVLIGSVLIFLIYKIGKNITNKPEVGIFSALVAAFSPVLIFLSRTPNEIIVLATLFSVLYLILIKEKFKALDFFIIALISILAVLTSKYAWFILGPFVCFTIFKYQTSLVFKKKIFITAGAFLISFVAIFLFLQIPQSKRSLVENNFTLFSDVTISNGISKTRGQGALSGWPPSLGRILFNKSEFISTGLVHWVSNLQPSIYFGEFDGSGRMGLIGLGAWAKILVVPLFLGLILLVKDIHKNKRSLLGYFLLFTWPALFIYPKFEPGLVVLTIPFVAVIIGLGISKLNKKIIILILLLVIGEVVLSLSYLSFQQKSTNEERPAWLGSLIGDIKKESESQSIAVSDDIAKDMVPYIGWYSIKNPQDTFFKVDSPYKFRQTKLKNIRLIGADGSFRQCGKDEKITLFLSERDIQKAADHFDPKVLRAYLDKLNKDRVYFVSGGVCLSEK